MGNARISMLFRPVLIVAICFLVLSLTGCTLPTPGETPEEVSIRHQRLRYIKLMQLQYDIDAVMYWDEPSKLTERIIR